MKWYPDPEHIHCIQSCEVRVQTAKHSCIKCASMCKHFSSNISLTQDSETVKRVNVCFSCNHTVPDQRIEYSLLQLRKPKLSCFLYVTDLMFLMWWEEKKWVAACTFYILDLVVTEIHSCPLVFIHADSTWVPLSVTDHQGTLWTWCLNWCLRFEVKAQWCSYITCLVCVLSKPQGQEDLSLAFIL